MSFLQDCFGGQVKYIGGVSKLQKYQQVWKKVKLKYGIVASTFNIWEDTDTHPKGGINIDMIYMYWCICIDYLVMWCVHLIQYWGSVA